MRRPADVRLRLRASGAAPAVEVWDRYARTARWSTWSPQVRAVDLPARIAPGARGAVHGPAGLRADVVVEAVDEDARTWSWSVVLGRPRLPGVRLRLEHGVVAAAGGSRTWLVLRGPAPVVLGYLVPARLALARLVRP